MDVSTVLGAFGAAASGGILGLFGVGAKMWASHKAEQAKFAYDIAMRKADREEMSLEHQFKMKETEANANRDIAVAEQDRLATETQAAADVELAEMDLRTQSYANDKTAYGGGLVDTIRGLMRPALTVYFALLMALITYQLFQITGQMVGSATAQYLLKEVINTCIFLATTSVTWWFGSRPVKRH
ncbi:MAG: hypothetical protein GXO35_07665 [Gammaproteobacteria bacterium]|nr:hypothetical protein [Gammaproteobacteria bacterium]